MGLGNLSLILAAKRACQRHFKFVKHRSLNEIQTEISLLDVVCGDQKRATGTTKNINNMPFERWGGKQAHCHTFEEMEKTDKSKRNDSQMTRNLTCKTHRATPDRGARIMKACLTPYTSFTIKEFHRHPRLVRNHGLKTRNWPQEVTAEKRQSIRWAWR